MQNRTKNTIRGAASGIGCSIFAILFGIGLVLTGILAPVGIMLLIAALVAPAVGAIQGYKRNIWHKTD